jgi:hypothetical protein
MAFHVGQKVARFAGSNHPKRRHIPSPKIGEPVTITNIFVAANGIEQIELKEYPAPDTEDFYAGFIAEFFRPLIERKSSTSTGFEILDGIRKRESVGEPVKIKIGCGND